MKSSSDVIKKQLKTYQPNYIKYGNTPKGTFQNNTATQYLRFSKLIERLDIQGSTVHDIGCGIGDMHVLMNNLGIEHHYIGTDIVPEMIDSAKQLHPQAEFLVRDIMEMPDEEMCDYSVLSGTFNIPGDVDRKEWKSFCLEMIRKMFKTSRKAISFNFLTTYSTYRDPTLMYFEPAEILDFCLTNLSRFVVIDHDYALYEYTVTVSKENHIASLYSDDAFKKYFPNT